jgi:hypothetical protein
MNKADAADSEMIELVRKRLMPIESIGCITTLCLHCSCALPFVYVSCAKDYVIDCGLATSIDFVLIYLGRTGIT